MYKVEKLYFQNSHLYFLSSVAMIMYIGYDMVAMIMYSTLVYIGALQHCIWV